MHLNNLSTKYIHFSSLKSIL